jgi:TonB-dependent receptor
METDYSSLYVIRTHFETGYTEDTLSAKRSNEHWFPNFHLQFKGADWWDIRFAATKSLTRPDYNYFIPRQFANLNDDTGVLGNTRLKPIVSKNFDLFLSLYSNTIGLFTIGGFYKRMNNIFYETDRLKINLHEVTWPGATRLTDKAKINVYVNSPYKAEIKGLEVNWQSNFWYLPKPLNSLVINANYAHIWSETKYPQIYVDTEVIPGFPPQYIYTEVDTFRTGRLLYQGNDIANIAVGFDYKGFSARLSFAFQGDVLSKVGERPEEDEHTQDRYKWDFTIKQKLPIRGLQIYFSGVNITHASTDLYRIFGPDFGAENVSKITYNPNLYEIGLRYSL